MADSRLVSVLVPVAVDTPYTYGAPAGMQPGAIVEVPLGTRTAVGVIWDDPPDETIGHNRLRAVGGAFDVAPLSKDMRSFVDWVAHYTLAPRGMVLRMVLRSSSALSPEPPVERLKRLGALPERMTPAREKALAAAGEGEWTRTQLARAAGVSAGVVDGLIAAGTLQAVPASAGSVGGAPQPDFAVPALSADQAAAVATARAAVDAGRYSTILIDGVTGSGKTEVYLEGVAAALTAGRQVLVLVPEIALTGEFFDRFRKRFGAAPAEWHSAVSAKARARIWRGVADGSVRVVAGARSALFLPFRELGLIVVDEEHDLAYKQEEGAIYNARDMAVVRAHLAGFPVVLSSATPSVESRVNADAGRYTRIVLSARYREAPLPDMHAIDLRRDQPERGRFLSPTLISAIGETLSGKRQALLFLNRRGYAPLTLCRTCGHRFQCPNCSTWLVEHRFRGTLMCHHCGHSERRPPVCPSCEDADSLVAVGPGVERLAEEVALRFPGARTIALSSDIVGGVERLREELASVARGDVDIVIGTQLVAKGHNFPLINLVGVVDADLGLAHGDLRAAERTFQLLSQVTGRAGRAGGASRAFLQTYSTEQPVIQALVDGDREAFYAREIAARRAEGLPPFGRLAALIISAGRRDDAFRFATAMRQAAPVDREVELLGPAEAPLAVVRGRHRFRLLARSPRAHDLQGYIRGWLTTAPQPKADLRVQVDVDPQSFL